MGIAFKVGNVISEVGAADFLYAFFSTISACTEPDGWGTQYPTVMRRLYGGRLESQFADQAIAELVTLRKLLEGFSPASVVWDYENRDVPPPWGHNISPDITDLSNYFVTSSGRDVFDTLLECLTALKDEGGELTIEMF